MGNAAVASAVASPYPLLYEPTEEPGVWRLLRQHQALTLAQWQVLHHAAATPEPSRVSLLDRLRRTGVRAKRPGGCPTTSSATNS